MKKYMITADISKNKLLKKIKKYQPEYILYRDKSNENYKNEAKDFMQTCLSFKDMKIFLHSDIELAHTLHAYGVHLTSLEFKKIKRAKVLQLQVIISTHTKDEVLRAEQEGADYVTYSPIFQTPHKGEPKGVEDLKKLLKTTRMKVFALGGIIEEKQVNEIEKTAVYGFASIRYFD